MHELQINYNDSKYNSTKRTQEKRKETHAEIHITQNSMAFEIQFAFIPHLNLMYFMVFSNLTLLNNQT
jgi:hypothetical protein